MTETQAAIFLETLSSTGLEATSARTAGVTLARVRRYKEADPGFAEQVQEAHESFVDTLEQEAIRRARDGTDKPVYYKGELIDTVKEYSDSLLTKLLTGRRSTTYGDKREITGAAGGAITIKIAEFTDPGCDFL